MHHSTFPVITVETLACVTGAGKSGCKKEREGDTRGRAGETREGRGTRGQALPLPSPAPSFLAHISSKSLANFFSPSPFQDVYARANP